MSYSSFLCNMMLYIFLIEIQYKEFKWKICGNIKILIMLFRKKDGLKNVLFSMWDSKSKSKWRDKSDWFLRKNLILENLVDLKQVLLSHLQLKLCLVKEFVKTLDKTSNCFLDLIYVFQYLSESKIKEDVFVGPDRRWIVKDGKFDKKWIRLKEMRELFWKTLIWIF